MDILIATTNAGKVREYADLMAGLPLRCLSLRDVGLDGMDVDETANTFEGNAELKVRAYAQASGLHALADDSGLVVDALGGQPGVFSHRWAGANADDAARYTKLLRELEGVPDAERTARFVCVIAVANPHTLDIVTADGMCEGRIARAPDLSGGGFGYDPVFIADGYTVALSALPPDEKNRISHRGRAAYNIRPILQQMAQELGE